MTKKQRASKQQKRVYANRKQKQFLKGKQRRKTFVGGRGSGKSATIGMENFVRAQEMPRAKSFLAAMTYDQLLTKTLPSVLEAWNMLGLKEYDPKLKMGHYVIGKRPPPAWPKPYLRPQRYENVLTLINGYTIELLSINGIENRRGGSYDAGDIDESALVKKEVVTRILGPSLRGNPFAFENSPRHWALCDYTSAPWTPEGQWVFEVEELAKQDPANFLFVEATVYDNVVIWGGPERLEAIRKSTPKLEWEVEYMNVRLSKMPNSFYPAFSFDKHAIPVDWVSYVRNDQTGLWSGTSDFIDPNRPIETSWDFNAGFTSLIVCQEAGEEFRIGNELYVKDGDSPLNKIDALADKFLATYQAHRCKTVFLHGDRNGNNKTANSDLTFYEQIRQRLEAKGWEVYLMVSGLDPDHQLKHKYLNAILLEDSPNLPRIRFHQTQCKFTIISIQNSPMSPDWKKDKRSERTLLEQERATHLSDCFVAGTMVTTATGQRPIEQVAVGELVLTRAGWKPVTRAWLSRRNVEVGTYLIAGREITCTPEHRIWTKNRGWVEAGHLTASDTFCTLEETNAPLCALNASPLKASGLSATQKPQMLPTAAISRATGLTGLVGLFPLHSIGLCGWTPTALFPKASTSIMSMVTAQITASKTLPALVQLSTLSCIGMRSLPTTRLPASTTCLPLPNQQPQPGTNQTRAAVGTASTARSFGTSGHCSTRCVPGAVMPTKPRTSGALSCASVPASVTPTPATIAASITNNEPAHPVVTNSLSTGTSKPKPAHAHALRVSAGQADVYDLSVAEQHEFFANGILVHNCFDNIVYRKYANRFDVAPDYQVYFLGR